MIRCLIAVLSMLPFTAWRADAQAMARVRPPVKSTCESMPTTGRTIGELCSATYDDTLRYWTGSVWATIGMGDATFTGAPPADYVVYDLDGTYQAMNARTIVIEYTSNDAGEVIKGAIDGLGTDGGTILVLPGVYNYTNTLNAPIFRTNRTGWTRIIGNRAVLHLSTGSPRAFRIDPDATGVLRYIEISGFVVDAEDAGTNSGPGILFSDRKIDNTTIEDLSFDQIYIHDITINGVYASDAYLARDGIQIVPTHRAANNTPANETITNITIERLKMYGFNNGIQILMNEGYNKPSTTVFDNIIVRDVIHEPSTWEGKPQTNYRFGGLGIMGRVLLENLVATNSGDNNLEVNNALDLTVNNATFQDASATNILLHNFNEYTDTDIQVARFNNLSLTQSTPKAYWDTWDSSGLSIGIWGVASHHYGRVVVDGFSFTRPTGRPKFAVRVLANLDSISLKNAKVTFPAAEVKNDFYLFFSFGNENSTLPTRIDIDNLSVLADITKEADAYQNVSILGFAGEDVYLDVSNVDINLTFHSITAGAMQLIHLLESTGRSNKFSGVLDRINFRNLTGIPDSGSTQGITWDSSAQIDPTFRIQNSYFGSFPANANEVYAGNPDIYLQYSRSGNYPDDGYLRSIEIANIPSDNDGAFTFFEDFIGMPVNNPYKFFPTGTMAHANQDHNAVQTISAVGNAYVYSTAAEDSGFNFTGVETTNNSSTGWYISPAYFDTLRIRGKAFAGSFNNGRVLFGGVRTEDDGDIMTKLAGAFFWCAQQDDVDADGTAGDEDADSTCGEAGEDSDDCNWYAVVMNDSDGTSGDDETLGDNTATTEIVNTEVVCFPTPNSNADLQRFTMTPHNLDITFSIEGAVVATTTEVVGNIPVSFFGSWMESNSTDFTGHVLDYVSLVGSRRQR